ncbi:MFS transporter [Streptomyces sp. NPDC021020]|uniref:MFS transporter n=1 Tax=Streptomyces sp. NPDC021020 TaxID=3365109 RepID=UPI0037BC40AD
MDRATAYRRRWQILAVLCLSLVLIGLDTLILNLALPSIQSDLDTSGSALQWVVDSYALAFGGLLLLAGGLSDRFGRKRTLLVGLTAFLGFSVGAAFAVNGPMLIGFRAAMGVAAALMMPATLTIIKDIFPPEEQAKAIGIWSGAAAVGVPLGPALSGLLLQHFWWGSMFLINVPIALIALIAGIALIPESRDTEHPGLDLVGAVLSVLGLVALVYGLVEAPHFGWADPVTLGALAAGVVLLVAFVRWERRTAHPMMPVELFKLSRFGGGALSILCVSFGMYTMLFLLTQYLQSVLGLGPLAAGVRMFAIGTMMIGAPLSAPLVERVGLKATVAFGLLLCGAALAMLGGLDDSSQAMALWALAVFGLGMGIALPAATDAIVMATPARQAGAGSAMADVGMQVGGSLGIAVTGSLLSTFYRDKLPSLSGIPADAHGAVRDSIGSALAALPGLGAPGQRLVHSVQHAFVSGLNSAIVAGVAVSAVGAVAAVVVLPRARMAAVSTPGETEDVPADDASTAKA